MSKMNYDVFISYRRKGGAEKAQLVKSEIKQRGVEEKRIFLDTHSLHDGDFEQKIRVAIEQSQSVIIIISKGCFDEVKETDFWYIEIKEALLQGKKVIPIFFDGITSFATLNVPQELEELTKKNAITYQHEYADAAFDKLLMFIGLQEEAYPIKKRGCLFSFKYKGCLVSVALIGLVVFVLAPIFLSQFGSTDSPGEDDRVCYAPNDGEKIGCPPDLVEQEQPVKASKPVKADVFPEKKNEELYGSWRGLNEDLILSFQAKDVIMEKQDGGIIKTKRGEYKVNGNRIVFNWEKEGKQVVRFDIVGDELRLNFEDGQMIMLIKRFKSRPLTPEERRKYYLD